MTDQEVSDARQRAGMELRGLEGLCSQHHAHLRLARDVIALADALSFTRALLDEELLSDA